MSEPNLDAKYAPGQRVSAYKNPAEKLIVRRYYHRIYYCRTTEGEEKEHAFFEDEITAAV